MLEKQFQKKVIAKIKERYPGAVVLKNDPTYFQGIPDWLVLYGPEWYAFEIKRSENARVRPNQKYWVEYLDEMGFARFVYPENVDEVLDELQTTFRSNR